MNTPGTAGGEAPQNDHRAVLRVCASTDVGLERHKNQDTFVIADLASGSISSPCGEVDLSLAGTGYLMLVCDGMGGAAAGEVAAQIAAGVIRERLVQAGEAVVEHPDQALDEAVTAANRAILKDAEANRKRRGMGTTCTAAVVLPDTVTVAQVGDSRAYLLRQGKLWSLTKDQSLATQLMEAGVLTEAEVSSFPYRHVLSQALGTKSAVEPAISRYQLQPGDRVLICSDGLHGTISDADIQTTLVQSSSLAEAVQALVNRALTAGGPDNVTVVLGEYRASSPP